MVSVHVGLGVAGAQHLMGQLSAGHLLLPCVPKVDNLRQTSCLLRRPQRTKHQSPTLVASLWEVLVLLILLTLTQSSLGEQGCMCLVILATIHHGGEIKAGTQGS